MMEEAGWRTASTCLDTAWRSRGEKYDTSLPQTAYVSHCYPTWTGVEQIPRREQNDDINLEQ